MLVAKSIRRLAEVGDGQRIHRGKAGRPGGRHQSPPRAMADEKPGDRKESAAGCGSEVDVRDHVWHEEYVVGGGEEILGAVLVSQKALAAHVEQLERHAARVALQVGLHLEAIRE